MKCSRNFLSGLPGLSDDDDELDNDRDDNEDGDNDADDDVEEPTDEGVSRVLRSMSSLPTLVLGPSTPIILNDSYAPHHDDQQG